jgi:hypothetical protein
MAHIEREMIRDKLGRMLIEIERKPQHRYEKLVRMGLALEALDSVLPHKDLDEILALTDDRYDEIAPTMNNARKISQEIKDLYFKTQEEKDSFKKLSHDDIQELLAFIISNVPRGLLATA